MYNGVGLQTARGSGTSGFVQRSKASVRKRYTQQAPTHTVKAASRGKAKAIMDHELRRNMVDLPLAEMEEQMEDDGVPQEKIDSRLDAERLKLMRRFDERMGQQKRWEAEQKSQEAEREAKRASRPDAHLDTPREDLNLTMGKSRENNAMARAFGIRREGDSMAFKSREEREAERERREKYRARAARKAERARVREERSQRRGARAERKAREAAIVKLELQRAAEDEADKAAATVGADAGSEPSSKRDIASSRYHNKEQSEEGEENMINNRRYRPRSKSPSPTTTADPATRRSLSRNPSRAPGTPGRSGSLNRMASPTPIRGRAANRPRPPSRSPVSGTRGPNASISRSPSYSSSGRNRHHPRSPSPGRSRSPMNRRRDKRSSRSPSPRRSGVKRRSVSSSMSPVPDRRQRSPSLTPSPRRSRSPLKREAERKRSRSVSRSPAPSGEGKAKRSLSPPRRRPSPRRRRSPSGSRSTSRHQRDASPRHGGGNYGSDDRGYPSRQQQRESYRGLPPGPGYGGGYGYHGGAPPPGYGPPPHHYYHGPPHGYDHSGPPRGPPPSGRYEQRRSPPPRERRSSRSPPPRR